MNIEPTWYPPTPPAPSPPQPKTPYRDIFRNAFVFFALATTLLVSLALLGGPR